MAWAGSPKGQEEGSAQLETALYGAIAALPVIHTRGKHNKSARLAPGNPQKCQAGTWEPSLPPGRAEQLGTELGAAQEARNSPRNFLQHKGLTTLT